MAFMAEETASFAPFMALDMVCCTPSQVEDTVLEIPDRTLVTVEEIDCQVLEQRETIPEKIPLRVVWTANQQLEMY